MRSIVRSALVQVEEENKKLRAELAEARAETARLREAAVEVTNWSTPGSDTAVWDAIAKLRSALASTPSTAEWLAEVRRAAKREERERIVRAVECFDRGLTPGATALEIVRLGDEK